MRSPVNLGSDLLSAKRTFELKKFGHIYGRQITKIFILMSFKS